MEHAVRNVSILRSAGVGLQFIVAPTSARNGTGITEIETPLRKIDISAGTSEFVTEDKVGDGVNGGSPTAKKAEDEQGADSQ